MGLSDNLKGDELGAFVRRTRALETQAPVGFTSVTKGRLRVASAEGLVVEGSQRISGTSTVTGTQTVSGTQAVSGTQDVTGALNVSGPQTISGGGTLNVGTLTISPTGPWGSKFAAPNLDFDSTSARFTGEILSFGGASFFGLPPTTNAANLRMSGLGQLQEVTSAAKFKIDAQQMNLPDALLDVPVKSWIDRSDAETIGELFDAPRPLTRADHARWEGASLNRVPGVIAEEVAAAGGDAFVSYDADGEIRGVDYDRLALARTAILADRLAAALDLIDVMHGRISALEATASS